MIGKEIDDLLEIKKKVFYGERSWFRGSSDSVLVTCQRDITLYRDNASLLLQPQWTSVPLSREEHEV